MKKITYSTKEYPFARIVEDILGTTNLSKIHTEDHFSGYDLFKREEDQSTKYHKLYYNHYILLNMLLNNLKYSKPYYHYLN